MSQKTPISLNNFFIYNFKFGPKEGEEEKKILYYHPNNADIDTKIKDIGLCEAIIKFTNTFTNEDDDSCQHLRSQKTTQFYYQPESGYWMIMTINVPHEKKEKSGGIEYIEYKSDEVHVKIFRQILRQSYQMFRLFNGKFIENFNCDTMIDQSKVYHLRNKLNDFYENYYLKTLNFQQFDILNAIKSIQFLPVNQLQFLRLHNFLKIIESQFIQIKSSIFLYNEQVVWSGINENNLYSIYEYLLTEIFPQFNGNSMSRTYSLDAPQCGQFLTANTVEDEKYKKVYLYNNGNNGDDNCEIFNLIIYRASNALICLFVDDKEQLDSEFYAELHTAIGGQLSQIATEICESLTINSTETVPSSVNVNQQTGTFVGPKFLFFNQLNYQHSGNLFATKSTKLNGHQPVPTDVMNLLIDLYNNSTDNDVGNLEETIIKTMNDYWIVKKQNNWRHFYVIVNKSATLLEISDEAKRIFDEHTKDIYF